MRINVVALLALLVSGNANAQLVDIFSGGDALLDRLGNAIGCDFSARLKADMPRMPLYSDASGACELVSPVNTGHYFRDSACSDALDFYRTEQQEFCAQSVDKQNLGNGASVRAGWTLSPGTRYDIGVQSLDGLLQPYRKSVSYRTISTDAGECQLEMRIYKNNLIDDDEIDADAQGGPPLIAIHGGSWKARGFGTIGIESAAAHFTGKGFVVFAPFYRLLSDSEPDLACQSAPIEQIVSDAEFALQWVAANGAQYGATGKPVLMGQSAGAHLALSVAVNQRDEIAAALLMYPPTDFSDFINLVVDGEYTNEQGLRIFSDVLGVDDASFADISAPTVVQNSFPMRVASQISNPSVDAGVSIPPMIIFHGLADDLVPASQSVRLCNALANKPLDDGLSDNGSPEQLIDCGADSRLHLYANATHALDVCLTGSELLTAACPAGGRDNRRLIAAALDSATDQLLAIALAASVIEPADMEEDASTTSRSGGGTINLIALLWLLLLHRTTSGRLPGSENRYRS